jgi:hypothetical protein
MRDSAESYADTDAAREAKAGEKGIGKHDVIADMIVRASIVPPPRPAAPAGLGCHPASYSQGDSQSEALRPHDGWGWRARPGICLWVCASWHFAERGASFGKGLQTC